VQDSPLGSDTESSVLLALRETLCEVALLSEENDDEDTGFGGNP